MHAAWAIGEVGGDDAVEILRDALTLECNDDVRREIMDALGLQSVYGADRAPTASSDSATGAADR
jgi:hypothetical protein